MTDLVKLLRDMALYRHDDLSVGDAAADRIEELECELAETRAKIERLRHSRQFYATRSGRLLYERKRKDVPT